MNINPMSSLKMHETKFFVADADRADADPSEGICPTHLTTSAPVARRASLKYLHLPRSRSKQDLSNVTHEDFDGLGADPFKFGKALFKLCLIMACLANAHNFPAVFIAQFFAKFE